MLQAIDARKVLVESVLFVERSTSFLPFSTSYIGIHTLVPEILSNRPSTKNPRTSTNIQKETTALNDNINERALSDLTKVSNADIKESNADIKSQLATLIALASPKITHVSSTSVFPPVSKTTFMNEEIDVKSDDIEAKTETTDILIANKIKEPNFLSINMPKRTRALSNSIFPRFSTALLAAEAPSSPLAKTTARAQPKATFLNKIDVNSNDIEAKTDTTDILIAGKIKECHFLSVDMPKSTCALSNSVFPRFSTPYVGIRSSVPALLAAETPSSPLAEISNLDKQPLEPTTNKPANPVTANLPVHDVVTEKFTTISMKIEVLRIEEQDSPSH
eukprot:scaffold56233_cov76-Attheya_sp.AAC.3